MKSVEKRFRRAGLSLVYHPESQPVDSICDPCHFQNHAFLENQSIYPGADERGRPEGGSFEHCRDLWISSNGHASDHSEKTKSARAARCETGDDCDFSWGLLGTNPFFVLWLEWRSPCLKGWSFASRFS
jgi:hypothetical protein